MKYKKEYNELRIKRVLLLDKMKISKPGHERAFVADEIIKIDHRLKEIEGQIGQTFVNGNYKSATKKQDPIYDVFARVLIFLIIFIWAAFLALLILKPFEAKATKQPYKHTFKTVKVYHAPKKQVNSYTVTATYYHAKGNECDSKPLITADGSEIDTNLLRKGVVRWVSLSRDLLHRWGGEYNYGDTIRVEHENPLLCGLWIIHDCMNRRFKQKIDFLVPVGTILPGLSHGLIITKYN